MECNDEKITQDSAQLLAHTVYFIRLVFCPQVKSLNYPLIPGFAVPSQTSTHLTYFVIGLFVLLLPPLQTPALLQNWSLQQASRQASTTGKVDLRDSHESPSCMYLSSIHTLFQPIQISTRRLT